MHHHWWLHARYAHLLFTVLDSVRHVHAAFTQQPFAQALRFARSNLRLGHGQIPQLTPHVMRCEQVSAGTWSHGLGVRLDRQTPTRTGLLFTSVLWWDMLLPRPTVSAHRWCHTTKVRQSYSCKHAACDRGHGYSVGYCMCRAAASMKPFGLTSFPSGVPSSRRSR